MKPDEQLAEQLLDSKGERPNGHVLKTPKKPTRPSKTTSGNSSESVRDCRCHRSAVGFAAVADGGDRDCVLVANCRQLRQLASAFKASPKANEPCLKTLDILEKSYELSIGTNHMYITTRRVFPKDYQYTTYHGKGTAVTSNILNLEVIK
jgi:hypothetical protein